MAGVSHRGVTANRKARGLGEWAHARLRHPDLGRLGETDLVRALSPSTPSTISFANFLGGSNPPQAAQNPRGRQGAPPSRLSNLFTRSAPAVLRYENSNSPKAALNTDEVPISELACWRILLFGAPAWALKPPVFLNIHLCNFPRASVPGFRVFAKRFWAVVRSTTLSKYSYKTGLAWHFGPCTAPLALIPCHTFGRVPLQV